jgi:diguanylate cyclase (GGDEF)-like protein
MQPTLTLVPNDRDRRSDELPSTAAEAISLAERLEEATRQLDLTRTLLAEKQRECSELASALAQDAHVDALTGLFNRRKFNELCAAEIARSIRYGTPLALIMVDIDHFKRVNDEHGHLVGDRALVDVAGVLGRRMRASDALCRWGGEEFMILAPHLDSASAVRMADKLRLAIAAFDFGPAGASPAASAWPPPRRRPRDRPDPARRHLPLPRQADRPQLRRPRARRRRTRPRLRGGGLR